MSSNHYNAHQRDQLLAQDIVRILANTDAIRTKASNDNSLAQRAQAEESARQDKRLAAEIERRDEESQTSIRRADDESDARIKIQRDEMMRRQDREDLMARDRLGSDSDGKAPGGSQWGRLWRE
jgi:hypothetical protein